MNSNLNDGVTARTFDAYAALRIPQYRLFTVGRNTSGAGDQMQSVAVAWELYARTHNPMTLGYVGLVQVAPILMFALFAGHIADKYPRKMIAIIGQLMFTACSFLLAALSLSHASISAFFVCLFCGVTARTFGNPARTALLPQIVPLPQLGNAISWDTSIRRIAVLSGAAFGGWLLDWSGRSPHILHLVRLAGPIHGVAGLHREGYPAVVYLTTAILGLVSAALLTQLRVHHPKRDTKSPITWEALIGGVRYIRSTRIVLATITLDLFAMLFAGATALLPVFQKDILHVGPQGLGWLRAAQSIGALFMALYTARMPPLQYPGRAMLWAIVGFGLATIVFGMSKSFALSMAALAVAGGLDMISIVVRQTLVQTLTPNEMRGRVNAVNSIFINSSNDVGTYESGLVAHYTTPVVSVVSGGVVALVVAAYAATRWPALRNYTTGQKLDSLEVYQDASPDQNPAGISQ